MSNELGSIKVIKLNSLWPQELILSPLKTTQNCYV